MSGLGAIDKTLCQGSKTLLREVNEERWIGRVTGGSWWEDLMEAPVSDRTVPEEVWGYQGGYVGSWAPK